MATNIRGAERDNNNHLSFEEIVPSSGWSEDSNTHLLIIDLPGFRREEVKLRIDDYGRIVASGHRQVNANKHVRFEQSYKIPDNSNIEDATAKFDDEILYLIIPKKNEITSPEDQHLNSTVVEETQNQTVGGDEDFPGENQENEPEKESEFDGAVATKPSGRDSYGFSEEMVGDGEEDDEFHDASLAHQVYNESLLRKVGVEVKRHKGIIITAIFAFSLGLFVSTKFQSNEK